MKNIQQQSTISPGSDYDNAYIEIDNMAYKEKQKLLLEQIKKESENEFNKNETNQEKQQNLNQESSNSFIDQGIDVAKSVGLDVARGVGLELPRRVVRGFVQGIGEMSSIADEINNALKLPSLQIVNKEGDIDLGIISNEEAKTLNEKGIPNVTDVIKKLSPKKPLNPSLTGDFIEAISQFATGLGAVGKIGSAAANAPKISASASAIAKKYPSIANALQNKYSVVVGKGALADILAFDEKEQRLSNLVESVPVLSNVVTKNLMAEQDDNFFKGKLKQGLEGAGLGVLTDVLYPVFKGIRAKTKLREQLNSLDGSPETLLELPLDEQVGVDLNKELFGILGDIDSDDLILNRKVKFVDGGDTQKVPQQEPVRGTTDESIAAQITENTSSLDQSAVANTITDPGEFKFTPEKETIKKQTQEQAPKNIVDDGEPFKINFARIDGPEEVKKLMDQMVNSSEVRESILQSRRGKISLAQTEQDAKTINGFDELMMRRVGQPLNAEQITAARIVYVQAAKILSEATKRASLPDANVVDLFNLRKMTAVFQVIQKEFMGARAEVARSLSSLRIKVGNQRDEAFARRLENGVLEEEISFSEKLSAARMSDFPSTASNRNNPASAFVIPSQGSGAEKLRFIEQTVNEMGGEAVIKNMARRLKVLMEGDGGFEDVNKFVRKSGLARTAEALQEAWIVGLLTGPQTHVLSLSSALINPAMTLGSRFVASRAFEGPIKPGETTELLLGMLDSVKLAFSNAAKVFREGGAEGFSTNKIELPRIRATSIESLDPTTLMYPFARAVDVYGKILSMFSNSLVATDEFTKTLLYNGQIRALSFRTGVANGLQGDELKRFISTMSDDPTELMKADANKFALYNTFNNDLDRFGKSVQSMLSYYPVLRYSIPFLRMPLNCLKYSFSHTPLAFFAKSIRDDITQGGVRGQIAQSKIAFGSLMMWVAGDLSLNGNITGAGPVDRNQRDALMRTGWRPYSIKIDNGYYSYNRFEPLASFLSMSSDLTEILTNYDSYDIKQQQEVEELATAFLMSSANQIVSKSFLQGFSDLSELFADPKRYASTFLNRYAGSLIPAGIASIERAVNPEVSYVFNMFDAIKARIPGLSNNLPYKLNVYGEKIQAMYPTGETLSEQNVEKLFMSFSPSNYSPIGKDTNLDRFLLRNGLSISMPQKNISFEKVRIDLTEYPEVYQRLVMLRAGKDIDSILIDRRYDGMTLKEYLTELVDGNLRESDVFLDLSNEEQQSMITSIVKDYTSEAKKQILDEYPFIQNLIDDEMMKRKDVEEFGNTSRDAMYP